MLRIRTGKGDKTCVSRTSPRPVAPPGIYLARTRPAGDSGGGRKPRVAEMGGGRRERRGGPKALPLKSASNFISTLSPFRMVSLSHRPLANSFAYLTTFLILHSHLVGESSNLFVCILTHIWSFSNSVHSPSHC